MAAFKYEHNYEKKALQERALKLKPSNHNIVATEQGWVQPHQNGTMELVVSFKGLDALLGDYTPELEGDPLTLAIPNLPPEPEYIPPELEAEPTTLALPNLPPEPEYIPPVIDTVLKDDEPVAPVVEGEEPEISTKKKPGRPPKVIEQTTEA